MVSLNEEKILISIIMPAYNVEKYISYSINSVLKQTYSNWELIVIDDGSNDDTVKVIKQYEYKDSRIRFYKNEINIGVSNTRNKAISLANGSWIAFLDSDDIWHDRKLEKQIYYIKKNRVEFTFTGSLFINEKGEEYKGIYEVPNTVNFSELKKNNVISCSSVLIKKDFFMSIKMENDDMHEDYAVWLRVLRTGVIAHGINEPLLIYRISKNSKSGKKLNTIKMTYRVYRFIGINRISSCYYMLSHILGAYKKYRKIR